MLMWPVVECLMCDVCHCHCNLSLCPASLLTHDTLMIVAVSANTKYTTHSVIFTDAAAWSGPGYKLPLLISSTTEHWLYICNVQGVSVKLSNVYNQNIFFICKASLGLALHSLVCSFIDWLDFTKTLKQGTFLPPCSNKIIEEVHTYTWKLW